MVQTRDIRQRDIINPKKLSQLSSMVIGCGAIGRNVALELGKMGFPKIEIIDFDKVGMENLAPQGFFHGDIGEFKVGVTKKLIANINPDVNVTAIEKRWCTDMEIPDIIFCCVDDMDARKVIFDSVHKHCKLFLESRMSAETFKIFSVYNEKSAEYWIKNWFPQSEAYGGSCTSKSTNYCAGAAATFMITQFSKWLREIEPEFKVEVNLLTMEIEVNHDGRSDSATLSAKS